MRDYFELLRVHQWAKNGFVFATPLFARELGQPGQFLNTLYAFLAFCLASSAVYILNDLVDLERDRTHPAKRGRPLASGRVAKANARLWMFGVLVAALATALLLVSPQLCAILITYILANVAYSFFIKYIVILDVAFIAAGFVLRILAGAVATGAPPSFWLLLCTINVALFLGFVKRRAELIALGGQAVEHREVLAHYSPGFLDQMISIVTTTTLVCYILYTIDDRTMEYFGSRAFVVTIPFVMYGIFRYLYIAYHREEGGSPTRIVLTDPLFIVNGLFWALTCVAIIYWGADFSAWIE